MVSTILQRTSNILLLSAMPFMICAQTGCPDSQSQPDGIPPVVAESAPGVSRGVTETGETLTAQRRWALQNLYSQLIVEALIAYQWQVGAPPQSIQDVVDAQLLFFVPTDEAGQPLLLRTYEHGEMPAPNEFGVRLRAGKIDFARHVSDEERAAARAQFGHHVPNPLPEPPAGYTVDPADPTRSEIGTFATLDYDLIVGRRVLGLSRPEFARRPESSVRAELEAYHADNPNFSGHGLTLSYLMISDSWAARRLFTISQQAHLILATYAQEFGTLPSSLDELLREMHLAHAHFQVIEAPATATPEDFVFTLACAPSANLSLATQRPGWDMHYEARAILKISQDPTRGQTTALDKPSEDEWAEWESSSPVTIFTAILPE